MPRTSEEDDELVARLTKAQKQGQFLGDPKDYAKAKQTVFIRVPTIGSASILKNDQLQRHIWPQTTSADMSNLVMLSYDAHLAAASRITEALRALPASPTLTSHSDPSLSFQVRNEGAAERTKKRTEAMATEREVTDAKLEAVEARVETRLTSIEAKLDRLADQFAVGIQRSVDASDRAEAAAKVAEARAEEARRAAGSTKWNILFTGLTVIAVIVAMWGLWSQGIELVSGLLESKP